VFAAVSLLLGYPDERLRAEGSILEDLAAALEAPAGAHLSRFIEHLRGTSPDALEVEYVNTFDLSRRCCLYLTYYAFGDTRRRGIALLSFTDTYRRAGFEPPKGELPDHLAVVCNFAAVEPEAGCELIVQHRAGLEALALALQDARSPYLEVVDALRAVLPAPAERELARSLELAREGPPVERVGLEPFAPPDYMRGRRR
jgi:nitrate reductase delta subunit